MKVNFKVIPKKNESYSLIIKDFYFNFSSVRVFKDVNKTYKTGEYQIIPRLLKA